LNGTAVRPTQRPTIQSAPQHCFARSSIVGDTSRNWRN